MRKHLEALAYRASEFDVIHSHVDHLAFSLLQLLAVPSVTTLHGRLDLPEYGALHAPFAAVNLISISKSQRQPMAAARYATTVLHGLPKRLLEKSDGAGGRPGLF
jgi:hypothetical protein